MFSSSNKLYNPHNDTDMLLILISRVANKNRNLKIRKLYILILHSSHISDILMTGKGVGTVLHMVDRKLIVRGSGRMRAGRMINSVVMMADNSKLGKVYDVFGPVNRPYISVKLFKDIKEKQLRKLRNKKVIVT